MKESVMLLSVEKSIMEILYGQLGEDVEIDTNIQEIVDDIDAVEINAELEIEFDLTIPESDFNNFITPADIVHYIDEKIRAKS